MKRYFALLFTLSMLLGCGESRHFSESEIERVFIKDFRRGTGCTPTIIKVERVTEQAFSISFVYKQCARCERYINEFNSCRAHYPVEVFETATVVTSSNNVIDIFTDDVPESMFIND